MRGEVTAPCGTISTPDSRGCARWPHTAMADHLSPLWTPWVPAPAFRHGPSQRAASFVPIAGRYLAPTRSWSPPDGETDHEPSDLTGRPGGCLCSRLDAKRRRALPQTRSSPACRTPVRSVGHRHGHRLLRQRHRGQQRLRRPDPDLGRGAWTQADHPGGHQHGLLRGHDNRSPGHVRGGHHLRRPQHNPAQHGPHELGRRLRHGDQWRRHAGRDAGHGGHVQLG